jgi:cell division protease FtsH
VLDNLVLQLMEHETLTRNQVLKIFSPIRQRATRGSYTGYGKRLPSDRPPVLSPKEMALAAASDGPEQPGAGNGQPGAGNGQALGGPAPGGQALGAGSEGPAQALGPIGPGGYGSPQGPDDGTPGDSAGGPAAGGIH